MSNVGASRPLPNTRSALAAGLGAFVFWGHAPLYWKLLGRVGSDEVIAHRVCWAVAFLAAWLLIRHRRAVLAHVAISRRVAAALLLSGALVAVNWLVFVYAVNTDRILSTSLGYFINPLVSVLLGSIVLREPMIGAQRIAVALAAAGTVYLTVRVGEPPWLALALAFSFGFYGLVRKLTDVGPMVGLFWETLMMMPVALAWLAWGAGHGGLVFGKLGLGHDLLIVGTGLVTVIPLVLFATAARGLPLITVGLMQYLAPSISFCLAVFLFREPFTFDHGVAFAAIWSALAIYTASSWHRLRHERRLARARA
ncbi:MAG: EamA family transporter RarD [Candidatus Wenzhouxiangella sp. M2_3B_020]